MDKHEVARSAGTIKKMAYVAQTYGNDFLVLETHGLEGYATLKKYRVSKEVFTEAHVSFGAKKTIFSVGAFELTLWVLQVTHNALTPFLILCIQT